MLYWQSYYTLQYEKYDVNDVVYINGQQEDTY